MILFIFEGKNREPTLFKTLEYLFLSKNQKQTAFYSYNNNIYNLYKEITETDFLEDIFSILKNKPQNEELKSIRRRADISEIYLFFDYDNHNNLEQNISNAQIAEMLNFFNDETSDFGKLFINYPMVESIYYAKNRLPDLNYYSYVSEINLGKKFKEKVNTESFYKNLDFLTFRMNKKKFTINIPTDENKIKDIKQNWLHLIEMNVKKANYIISEKNEIPQKIEEINQQSIFENQLKKYCYVGQIAILNSFPLFIFEYLGQYFSF